MQQSFHINVTFFLAFVQCLEQRCEFVLIVINILGLCKINIIILFGGKKIPNLTKQQQIIFPIQQAPEQFPT